jgi:hypothetical protein
MNLVMNLKLCDSHTFFNYKGKVVPGERRELEPYFSNICVVSSSLNDSVLVDCKL